MKLNLKLIVIFIAVSIIPFLLPLFLGKSLVTDRLAFANTAGFIGSILIFWQFVLGNRQIARKITSDYISMIKVHTFLGVYGMVFVFLHPILEMFAYFETLTFIFLPDFSGPIQTYITLGRFAFIFFLVIWFSSAIIRRTIKYRAWLVIHYSSYVTLALVFGHALRAGTFLNAVPLLRLYWFFLIVCFSYILILKLLSILNVGYYKYRLVSKTRQTDSITTYRFEAVSAKPSIIQPGQFFYIKTKRFGIEHPFTAAEFDEKRGDLIFSIKSGGSFTQKLLSLSDESVIFADGPYGKFTREGQNMHPKIIIAAGIGITPFIELVKRYKGNNTFLFLSNKKKENNIYRSVLLKMLGVRLIECITSDSQKRDSGDHEGQYSGKLPSTTVRHESGRITAQIINKHIKKEIIIAANYFICGPKAFINTMKETIINTGGVGKRIYTEEFSL